MSATVSAIVVTYNSEHVLEQCLKPLANHPDIEVVIVDNASSDNSIALAQEIVPDALLLERGTNAGFATAVNEGAEASTGKYLFLLNPDAIVSYSTIIALADIAKAESLCGVVGPLVVTPGSAVQTLPAGRFPSVWRILLHSTGVARFAGLSPALQGHYFYMKNVESHTRPIEIDWVTGGCMLVPREVWNDLGGLTERWFMYAEDIEFCYRAKLASYRVLLAPYISVEHAIGGSSKSIDGKASTVWISNLYDFYESSMSRGKVSASTWRLVAASGYALRAVVLQSLILGSKIRRQHVEAARLARARNFKAYAKAALHPREGTSVK